MTEVEIKSNKAHGTNRVARIVKLVVSIALSIYGGALSWIGGAFSSKFNVGAEVGIALWAIGCVVAVTALVLTVAEFVKGSRLYSYAVSCGAAILGSGVLTWTLTWWIKTDGLTVGCCIIAATVFAIVVSGAVLCALERRTY